MTIRRLPNLSQTANSRLNDFIQGAVNKGMPASQDMGRLIFLVIQCHNDNLSFIDFREPSLEDILTEEKYSETFIHLVVSHFEFGLDVLAKNK